MNDTSSAVREVAWQSTDVQVGDRLSGWDVTMGGEQVGVVLDRIGPLRGDCGGFRYRIQTDDGRTAVVFGELIVARAAKLPQVTKVQYRAVDGAGAYLGVTASDPVADDVDVEAWLLAREGRVELVAAYTVLGGFTLAEHEASRAALRVS